ncbi:unnamed protein product [Periconia digitata]|uniref:Plus3 domain-containing protein n=1 Tax=Periconia digitata TaxID=1303443 RepID=A0A9W4XMB4_9PLEO|nr:unnamed protein product [Periconia digitata]
MADDLDDELFALAGGDDEGDVEEGEASSVAASSPNSLGSDAMDESDSDRDDDVPAARDSDVLYPLEGKYRDLKDKAYIQGLSQLEREEILGQRAEEMSKAQFYAQVGQRAAQQNKKRKADSEEPDDSGPRRAVKPRVNEKLEAYKQAREQRGQQQRDRQSDRRDNRHRSSSVSRRGDSDVDAEGESEVEYDERDRSKPAAREELPASLTHFDSVRVGRGFFSVVCFYPNFEEALTGAFGRIGVGQDSQRRTLYKMAQIKGFTTGKPYVFEGKNGKKLATDQYVTCQHGNVKKEYQFQFLSNQHFSESDFDAYKQSMADAGMKLPTQSALKRKFDDLKALETRLWTDEDINARIAKMAKFSHMLAKSKSENPAPRIPTQSEAAAARLAEINRQSKRAETERIRKAQVEERQQKQQARKRAEIEARKRKAAEEEAKKAQEESDMAKGHLDMDALFDGGDSSRATTPKPQEKKKTERKGLPTFRKPKMDDDILASMDIVSMHFVPGLLDNNQIPLLPRVLHRPDFHYLLHLRGRFLQLGVCMTNHGGVSFFVYLLIFSFSDLLAGTGTSRIIPGRMMERKDAAEVSVVEKKKLS